MGNKDYYINASAWVLTLLVLTEWANARASDCRTGDRQDLHAFTFTKLMVPAGMRNRVFLWNYHLQSSKIISCVNVGWELL